jgi:hypothetical protein
MAPISSCPNDATWRKLVLGQVSNVEAKGLREHLGACLRCEARVQALKAEDTLSALPREQAAEGQPRSAASGAARQNGSIIDEEVRHRFESAWQQGQPRPIEQFLPSEQQPNYLPTLEELVLIEMELAWKTRSASAAASRPALVEAYLVRFPLLNQPARLWPLLRQEYRLRQRWGDKPTTEEYRARFPNLVTDCREIEAATLDSPAAHLEQLAAQCQQRASKEPSPDNPGATLMDSGDDPIHFLAPPQGPDELGRLGHFRVLEVLGRGGMGIVFRAEDTQLKRLVALKTMRPSVAARPSEHARFLREAQVAASVSHDHIVAIGVPGPLAGGA